MTGPPARSFARTYRPLNLETLSLWVAQGRLDTSRVITMKVSTACSLGWHALFLSFVYGQERASEGALCLVCVLL